MTFQLIKRNECHIPLGVTIIFDIVFALAESIPKFDCSVARTGDNLSIVGTEADRQNIGNMTNKTTCSGAGIEIPQAKSVIPRGREGELTVRRNHDVRNEVVVSLEDSFWETIGVFIASQLPDDNALV